MILKFRLWRYRILSSSLVLPKRPLEFMEICRKFHYIFKILAAEQPSLIIALRAVDNQPEFRS